MEPVTIVVVIVTLIVSIVAIRLARRSNTSEPEFGSAPIPARPSNIPATIRRKGRDFTIIYHPRRGTWGFDLGDDWIDYYMLMEDASMYFDLFDAAYPGEPFLPEGVFMEPPGAYAPEPESAIEAAPEPVAPPEPVHEPVPESPPVRETFSEPVAPEPVAPPAPSFEPPPSDFGSSDFGSSDFGGGDFGGGDD